MNSLSVPLGRKVSNPRCNPEEIAPLNVKPLKNVTYGNSFAPLGLILSGRSIPRLVYGVGEVPPRSYGNPEFSSRPTQFPPRRRVFRENSRNQRKITKFHPK